MTKTNATHQTKTLFLNIIDNVNNKAFTVDLTTDVLNEARSVKYNGDINDLVYSSYTMFKRKDFNKGFLLFTMYLLRTNNWRMLRDNKFNFNCLTYCIDNGAGYGHISGVCNTNADSHTDAHNMLNKLIDSLNAVNA